MANKRLIDANALKSQFLNYVRTEPHFHWGDWQNMCIHGTEIDEVIANAPTVDAVEVVRCKDCKHWKKCESSLIGEVMCCTGQGTAYIQKGAEDFCSCGERKTEDGKDYD